MVFSLVFFLMNKNTSLLLLFIFTEIIAISGCGHGTWTTSNFIAETGIKPFKTFNKKTIKMKIPKILASFEKKLCCTFTFGIYK